MNCSRLVLDMEALVSVLAAAEYARDRRGSENASFTCTRLLCCRVKCSNTWLSSALIWFVGASHFSGLRSFSTEQLCSGGWGKAEAKCTLWRLFSTGDLRGFFVVFCGVDLIYKWYPPFISLFLSYIILRLVVEFCGLSRPALPLKAAVLLRPVWSGSRPQAVTAAFDICNLLQ